jgi:hypothetical protein
MAKEFAKFQAAYKKLESDIKRCAFDAVSTVSSAYSLRAGDLSSSGEDHIRDSMADARDAGVTGDKLADFMKFSGFKDAVAVVKKGARELEADRVAFEALTKDAAKTQAAAEKLLADIAKDLKSRRDKSQSKADIQKLQTTLTADVADLKKAAALYGKMQKWRLDYPGQIDTLIAKLLKEAPAMQASMRDKNMLPQMLVDRKLKPAVGKAVRLLKEVNGACDEAIAKAGTDLKAAQPALKTAHASLAQLKEMNEAYQKAHKGAAGALAGSKDEKKVDEAVGKIAKAYALAESKLRGTSTTIKKAAKV